MNYERDLHVVISDFDFIATRTSYTPTPKISILYKQLSISGAWYQGESEEARMHPPREHEYPPV